MAHPSFGGPGLAVSRLQRITGVPGIPMNVNREVGAIHQHLANMLKDMRQPGAPRLSSSGGYVKRYIAGTKIWSEHSWGLAADYNAATNPMGRQRITDFVPSLVRPLCRDLGLSWGYDWTSGKYDAMHFEFVRSLSDARAITRALLGAGGAPQTEFSTGSSGQKVLEVQTRLDLLKFPLDDLDGRFGPKTAAAVGEFQRSRGLDDDEIVGKDTLKALETANLSLAGVAPPDLGDMLRPGSRLMPGQGIYAWNRLGHLVMQSDGHLVSYVSGKAMFRSTVRGTHAQFNPDGNLVLYVSHRDVTFPAWSANSEGSDRLVAQGDGNVVAYAGGTARFATGITTV